MIPTRIHGVIDYSYGVALMAAPYLFGFADGSLAQYALTTFGAGAIVYSLLTDYELGVVKLIPVPTHLALDVAAGVILILLPWLFGFAENTWFAYGAFGAASVVVPLLTEHRTRSIG